MHTLEKQGISLHNQDGNDTTNINEEVPQEDKWDDEIRR